MNNLFIKEQMMKYKFDVGFNRTSKRIPLPREIKNEVKALLKYAGALLILKEPTVETVDIRLYVVTYIFSSFLMLFRLIMGDHRQANFHRLFFNLIRIVVAVKCVSVCELNFMK
uniref:Uncharacterized protein n=1 Tax=Strongyloides venezuelensis TaxID=75913 RepID=A0A0K0FQX0_STRVS